MTQTLCCDCTGDRLLRIEYTTVFEYLQLLRVVASHLQVSGWAAGARVASALMTGLLCCDTGLRPARNVLPCCCSVRLLHSLVRASACKARLARLHANNQPEASAC